VTPEVDARRISPSLRLRLGVAGHVLWPWQGKRFGVDSPTPVPARDIAMLRIYYPFVHTLFTAVHFVSLRCPLGGESRVCTCSVHVTVNWHVSCQVIWVHMSFSPSLPFAHAFAGLCIVLPCIDHAC
jgi:hypothetical protein